jgi:hypothetical protein
MHRAFMAVEAALFFALTSDPANDEQPPTRPLVPAARPLHRLPARAQSACCAGPASARVANYNPAEAMSPCVSVSQAM